MSVSSIWYLTAAPVGSTWNGSLSSFMMSMCFLKSSNLCWKSSISLATNSEYFSCCTVLVGFLGFAGRMGTPGGPDSGPRAVRWTSLPYTVHNWMRKQISLLETTLYIFSQRSRRSRQASSSRTERRDSPAVADTVSPSRIQFNNPAVKSLNCPFVHNSYFSAHHLSSNACSNHKKLQLTQQNMRRRPRPFVLHTTLSVSD